MILLQSLHKSLRTSWLAVLSIAVAVVGCANNGQVERDTRVPELNLTSATAFLRANRTIVTGTVIDRISGRPIDGATVVVRFPDGTVARPVTNANGVFTAALRRALNQGGRVDAATVVDGSASDSAIMLAINPN